VRLTLFCAGSLSVPSLVRLTPALTSGAVSAGADFEVFFPDPTRSLAPGLAVAVSEVRSFATSFFGGIVVVEEKWFELHATCTFFFFLDISRELPHTRGLRFG
jgi:hypothetical protein